MTSLAAAMVASTSSSVWASDMKPASYMEGARYMPFSSMPRCHRANLSVGTAVASTSGRMGVWCRREREGEEGGGGRGGLTP